MSEIIEIKITARCAKCGAFVDINHTGFIRGAAEIEVKPCENCENQKRENQRELPTSD